MCGSYSDSFPHVGHSELSTCHFHCSYNLKRKLRRFVSKERLWLFALAGFTIVSVEVANWCTPFDVHYILALLDNFKTGEMGLGNTKQLKRLYGKK